MLQWKIIGVNDRLKWIGGGGGGDEESSNFAIVNVYYFPII